MMKLADYAGHVLARMARSDARIVVLDGDLADSDGAAHFALSHPDRFLMAGIAEQSMVSVAAGMAATGLLPCVFSFAAFLCYRAYDQIRICLSQAEQPVILVGSHAGGLSGRNGKTHAAPNDLALLLSLPGLRVWAPADFQDVEFALAQSVSSPGPTYIRLPRRQFAEEELLPGQAGSFRWLRPRQAVSIVTTGLASHWALEVADELKLRGLEIGVAHWLLLSADANVAEELQEVRQLVSVEDHCSFGGLGSRLAALCPDKPLTRFGWSAHFSGKSGLDRELLQHYGLSPANIAARLIAAYPHHVQ
jgi:transketolase